MMRQQVYDWLSSDPGLIALVEDRIYPVNMEDVKPPIPYIVYRMGLATPRTVPAKNESLWVWAHDNRGDYTRIDEILARVLEVLAGVGNLGLFYAAEWLETSEDLFDESSATITKYSRFRLVQRM